MRGTLQHRWRKRVSAFHLEFSHSSHTSFPRVFLKTTLKYAITNCCPVSDRLIALPEIGQDTRDRNQSVFSSQGTRLFTLERESLCRIANLGVMHLHGIPLIVSIGDREHDAVVMVVLVNTAECLGINFSIISCCCGSTICTEFCCSSLQFPNVCGIIVSRLMAGPWSAIFWVGRRASARPEAASMSIKRMKFLKSRFIVTFRSTFHCCRAAA